MEGIKRLIYLLWLIGLAVASHKIQSRPPSSDEAALNFIKQNLNDSADPCQDFQKFSSGKFEEVHEKAKLDDLRGSIRQATDVKLVRVLEQLRDRIFVDGSSAEGKVLQFYNACLTTSDKTRQFSNYLEILQPEKGVQWLETLAQLRRHGIENPLFRMNVVQDWDDLSHFVVHLKRPTYLKSMEVNSLRTGLEAIGTRKSKINSLTARIMVLIADLQNLPEEEDISYTRSIEEFEDQTGIQLSKYLEISFGRPFDASLKVKIDGLGYMEGLKEMLEKYDNEIVAAFIMADASLSLFDLDVVEPRRTDENLSERCAAAVHRDMELASELLYKEYYFRQGRQQRYEQEVHQLFEVLRDAFLAKIESNRLNLTDEEKTFLKKKLLAIKVRVGSLPNVPNQRRFVNDFYSDLELNMVTDMAKIQLNILEHRTRRTLRQLDRPTPKGDHFFPLKEYQDYLESQPYQAMSDLVIVPYDILQDPYFSPDQHDVFKVSLLGFLMIRAALENFHPYDMRYDSEGNFNEIMSHFGENPAYVERTTCLNRSESQYLDRHVLDVVALELVYDVYFGEDSKFSQEQPSFTKLPLKQLFLLNFAQTLMGWKNTENLHQAVRNLRAFGEVFNCPADASLNPENKCKIW